jgi:hypothetical protein
MPAAVVRVRRDFPQVLSLIKACALLHQAQRDKTPDGLPIAQWEDYQIVYDLLVAPFSAAQADGVTDKQREVVVAIEKFKASHPEGVPLGALAAHLEVSKPAVNQRLRNLLAHGYVRNLSAGQKGVPARYEVGDPLPPREENLPKPEAVREAVSKQRTGVWRAEQHLNAALNGLGTGLNGRLNTWPRWAVFQGRSRMEGVLRSVLRREGGVLRPPLRSRSGVSCRPARVWRADFGRTVKVLRPFWRGEGVHFCSRAR